MSPSRRPVLLVALGGLLIAPGSARAQETRAEVVQLEQADRQRILTPPRPNRVEHVVGQLEEWGILTGAPRGPYPWFGSVYPGGGFAMGAGVRVPFGDDGAVNVFGGYSFNRFARIQADVSLPTFIQDRATLTLTGRYVDAPDVKYFGVGNDTHQDHETRFGYTPRGTGARVDARAGRYVSIGGGVNYLDIRTSSGRTAPSIEEGFSPEDSPGLERHTFSYIHSTAHATVDWRKLPGYSGSGGLYRVQFDDFADHAHDAYSFRMVEAEARQLIPLLRANWVIALRALATVSDVDDTNAAPYFLMPSLGGGSTLRGYPDVRFRDRHRLLMNVELRWTPARFLDMALFYDTGKVASRRQDLDFDDLRAGYGIGLRVIGPSGYAFRIELAHSREHAARLVIGIGAF